MSYNWEVVKFSSLGKIITGKTPKTKIDKFWNGTIPFVTPKDIQINKYIHSTERYITNEGLETVSNQLLPKDSVCVSCIGNIGYVGYSIKNCITNQQINSIIPSKEYNNDYVYYLMKNYWPIFKSLENQSTTVSILNKSHFSSLEVKVSKNKEEQKAIANILSSLDDKIELNNKINKNLEELAQTLYKRWFVEFEFPNEEGEPYKTSGGEMVESELGLIPKGWEVGVLNDIIILHDNKRVPLSKAEREKRPGIYPYYGAASLMDYVDSYLFEGEYILLGEDGTVEDDNGYPILQYVYGKFWVNNHAHVIEGKNGFDVNSIYVLLKSTNIKSIVTGAVQKKINQGNLKSIKVVIPAKSLLTKYNQIIKENFELKINNEIEIQKLSRTRDTLLPKLMNGEIEVSIEK
jgi:type I restriction enzyme S subunit